MEIFRTDKFYLVIITSANGSKRYGAFKGLADAEKYASLSVEFGSSAEVVPVKAFDFILI